MHQGSQTNVLPGQVGGVVKSCQIIRGMGCRVERRTGGIVHLESVLTFVAFLAASR